jgi:hypothetical protein
VRLRSNATGSAPSVGPSLKIAEVDTTQSGSDAVTPVNRGTAPAIEGTAINPQSIGAETPAASLATQTAAIQTLTTTRNGTQRNVLDKVFRSTTEYVAAGTDGRSLGDVAANADSGTRVVAKAGVHTLNGPLEMAPHVTLHVPRGTTIEAPILGENERAINVGTGGGIVGHGVIDGRQSEQTTQTESEHLVAIEGVSNVSLRGVTLQNAPGGDCLYITNAENVLCEGFVADGGYRNSISITGDRSITVCDFIAKNAGGTPPQSGVDIEPNSDNVLEGVYVYDFRSYGNVRSGMQIHTTAPQPDAPVRVFVGNMVCEDNRYGVELDWLQNGRPGVVMRDCWAIGNQLNGFDFGAASRVAAVRPRAYNNGQDTDTSAGVGSRAGITASVTQYGGPSVWIIDAQCGDWQGTPTQKKGVNITAETGSVVLDGYRGGTHVDPSDVRATPPDSDPVLRVADLRTTAGDALRPQFPSRVQDVGGGVTTISGGVAQGDVALGEAVYDAANERLVYRGPGGVAQYFDADGVL